jgi:hypothetical protein
MASRVPNDRLKTYPLDFQLPSSPAMEYNLVATPRLHRYMHKCFDKASRFTDATKIVTAAVHAARRFAGTGRDSVVNAELKPKGEPGRFRSSTSRRILPYQGKLAECKGGCCLSLAGQHTSGLTDTVTTSS